MKKSSVKFELNLTYYMIFKYTDIRFISESKEIHFLAGNFGVVLSVEFVASRLSAIEKDFGEEMFFECKQRIDEAFARYEEEKKCIEN